MHRTVTPPHLRGRIEQNDAPQRSRHFAALQIAVRQIKPQIEFNLMVAGLHQLAEAVERLVVIALLQMCEFMHDNNPQEFRRRVLEQRRDANLESLSSPSTTRHARMKSRCGGRGRAAARRAYFRK